MFSYVAFRWCIVAKILIKVPSFKETSSALKDFLQTMGMTNYDYKLQSQMYM